MLRCWKLHIAAHTADLCLNFLLAHKSAQFGSVNVRSALSTVCFKWQLPFHSDNLINYPTCYIVIKHFWLFYRIVGSYQFDLVPMNYCICSHFSPLHSHVTRWKLMMFNILLSFVTHSHVKRSNKSAISLYNSFVPQANAIKTAASRTVTWHTDEI